MLEKTNSVYVIGTLVEVKKHQTGTFVKEGKEVPYIYVTFNDGDAIEAEFGIKEK